MSFFGRTFVLFALFAGAVHVFRKDIARVAGVLKKPTENFLKEVKSEIDSNKAAGAIASGVKSEAHAASTAAKAEASANAAEKVAAGKTTELK